MTDDLVKRLRDGGETCGADACKIKDARSGCLCAIAADRIEQLEAALRDASGIAKVAWMNASLGTLGDADYGCELCEWIAEAIAARAALEGKDG